MKYNITFKFERGAYQIKENPQFPTELLFNNTIECLYDWVGNVQQIIIDVIHEASPEIDALITNSGYRWEQLRTDEE